MPCGFEKLEEVLTQGEDYAPPLPRAADGNQETNRSFNFLLALFLMPHPLYTEANGNA